MLPDYLSLPADRLGQGTPVEVRVLGDQASLALDFAQTLFADLAAAAREQRPFTAILPVGPVDQFPLLADLIRAHQLDCRHAVFLNMDEYLTDQDEFVPLDHPLSFRAYMQRAFYDRLPAELAPPPAARVFPDPQDPEGIGRLIAARGGVDVCYGGIGINGHVAFNEPPEPGEPISNEAFAALPSRVLSLARETRTINSVTVGGGLEAVPRRAVTVGMREILGARRLRFYCNRPWQSAVVRRVLHGPIEAACPASFLRTHPAATLTVTDYVAAPPNIQLR